MDRHRGIYAGALLLFGVVAIPYLFRQVWFDEALTVMNFALMASPSAIYRNYAIPNNHILFSIVLHYWIKVLPPGMPLDVWCRLPSFLCGIGMFVYMFRRFRSFCGRGPLFLALSAMVLSTPFMIYSTAVRGYMLGALFAVAAAGFAMDIAVGAGFAAWFGYVLTSLGAVLTVPSDLCLLAAAVLLVLPMFGRRFYLKPQFYAIAVIPPVMLLLGYFPILHKLQAAMRLGEGWQDGTASLKLLYTAVLYSFVVVLVPAAATAGLDLRRHFRRLSRVRILIWLLPFPGALFFTAAPFPRVYFGLFPFFALLIARGLRRLAAGRRGRETPLRMWRIFQMMMLSTAVWGAVAAISPELKLTLSRHLGDRLGDDFIYGYYLRPEHTPAKLSRIFAAAGVDKVYISFLADPWAIMFYDTLADGKRKYVFDGPRGKVASLEEGMLAVLFRGESPAELETRFGVKLVPATEMPNWRIFKVAPR